jgi:hypothetical protein
MKQENEYTGNAANGWLFIVLSILLVAAVLTFTSCATNGYGCHGRSKIMTRVR